MDKRFKLLFIILCFAISAFAQQFSVSGRVTDADGHPLDFANVFIVAPGDKIEASAVCDVDGKFKMTVGAGKCKRFRDASRNTSKKYRSSFYY